MNNSNLLSEDSIDKFDFEEFEDFINKNAKKILSPKLE